MLHHGAKEQILSKEPKLDPLQQSLKCAWGLMQTPSNAVPRCTQQWHEIRIDADVARPTRQTPPFAEFVGRRGYQLHQLQQPVADLPAPVLSSRSKRARPESAPAASQPALFVFVVFFWDAPKINQTMA
jgi:hypothetical protein